MSGTAGALDGVPSRALLVVMAVLAWVTPSRAFHATFDYQVDRFEIDGNAFGASDGVPDLVDDFDDGVLSPGGVHPLGLPVPAESAGRLPLSVTACQSARSPLASWS